MSNGCWGFSLGLKQLMNETDHSPSSSFEVKNVMELYLSVRSSDQSTQPAHLSHLDFVIVANYKCFYVVTIQIIYLSSDDIDSDRALMLGLIHV
jgi:hypothetical protein